MQAEHFVTAMSHQQGYPESDSAKDKATVVRVIHRLLDSAGYNRNQFPIHVLNTGEEANAMVVKGASIVVYDGLLKKLHSDDEVATVLGHEIGHVLARHADNTKEQQDRADNVGIGSSIVGFATSIGASIAGVDAQSANTLGEWAGDATGAIAYGAYVQAFSRDQEYEADEIGLMLMAKAGYDPYAAPGVWKRSEEIFGSADSQVGAFFATHPASSDRMEALEKAIPMTAQYRKGGKGIQAEPSQPVVASANEKTKKKTVKAKAKKTTAENVESAPVAEEMTTGKSTSDSTNSMVKVTVITPRVKRPYLGQ